MLVWIRSYWRTPHIYMWYMNVIAKTVTQNTTLCGGSLGSRVDEERSKVRELMWFAGHIDHRYLERILRLRFASVTTPVWGSVYIRLYVKSVLSLLLGRFKCLCHFYRLQIYGLLILCELVKMHIVASIWLLTNAIKQKLTCSLYLLDWLSLLSMLDDYLYYACTSKVHIKALSFSTSDQTRLPAEFKHINKRRKRN